MAAWRQHLRTLRDQIVGENESPEFVARGWALGMFVGCLVPFGLQLLVSVPLSFALKCSRVGATVGTLVTNPVTIVFIYPAQTWFACKLMGYPLSWSYLESVCAQLGKVQLFTAAGWEILSEVGGRILSGFFLGGLILALVLTPITYFFVKALVCLNRKRKKGISNVGK